MSSPKDRPAEIPLLRASPPSTRLPALIRTRLHASGRRAHLYSKPRRAKAASPSNRLPVLPLLLLSPRRPCAENSKSSRASARASGSPNRPAPPASCRWLLRPRVPAPNSRNSRTCQRSAAGRSGCRPARGLRVGLKPRDANPLALVFEAAHVASSRKYKLYLDGELLTCFCVLRDAITHSIIKDGMCDFGQPAD